MHMSDGAFEYGIYRLLSDKYLFERFSECCLHRLIQQKHMGGLSAFCFRPIHPPSVLYFAIYCLDCSFSASLLAIDFLVSPVCQFFIIRLQHDLGELSSQFTYIGKYFLLQHLKRNQVLSTIGFIIQSPLHVCLVVTL